MAPMAELCITEARGEEETWKKISNTRKTQIQKMHKKYTNAINQKYTNNTGQELVAAEVAAKPAADMADIGDMPRKYKYKYTGMDLKQKYKLDPPGMEDMLIAV